MLLALYFVRSVSLFLANLSQIGLYLIGLPHLNLLLIGSCLIGLLPKGLPLQGLPLASILLLSIPYFQVNMLRSTFDVPRIIVHPPNLFLGLPLNKCFLQEV